jgi:hypothetical protein
MHSVFCCTVTKEKYQCIVKMRPDNSIRPINSDETVGGCFHLAKGAQILGGSSPGRPNFAW